MKRGVLVLNFGGPSTLDEVKPFLYRLFCDPDILVGWPAGLRHALAFFISRAKGKSSVEIYRRIGGGSPQLRYTRAQAASLAERVREHEIETRVVVGMRSSEPGIPAALAELKAWGADELVLLPLFPQFSTTTTGSCFNEVGRALKKLQWRPVVREVRSWPEDGGYLALQRERIDEALAEAEAASGGEPVHVLFSAHSLPLKIVRRGDPYPLEVNRTVRALAAGLGGRSWSLAFQSRNGPVPWLKPYTEDELARLGRAGHAHVVVVPVSFVSDHVETLYELDILYAEHARAHGVTGYRRARAFNDDPRFAQVLERLLEAR